MPIGKEIRVRVPASSANLGPGFDALAIALGLYLRCTLRGSANGLRISASGTEAAEIPCDESNLIWRTFAGAAGPAAGDLELEIANEIPLGKGLGSSAAAILAGLALADAWLGTGSGRQRLLEAAAGLEGHPDNVAAAALGGLVVSCQAEDGRVLAVKSHFPQALQVVVVIPQLRLATESARAALPSQYRRRDVVFNLQRVALLLAALQNGVEQECLSEAMRDSLHQPYRAPLIPGLQEILQLENVPGLLGVALSGAGPSVLCFCESNGGEIGRAIGDEFRAKGVGAQALTLPVDPDGLTVEM